ncbi:unnamed protein product [Schistosoma turkestanicum]|nr:unnamed protein product [Schistosoma turkestanicum]
MPIMKLYQITSATSVPSSALIQFYKSKLFNKIEHDLMDNTIVSAIRNLNIVKQMDSISSKITLLKDSSEKVNKSSNVLLKLYLEKLANILQSHKNLMKSNSDSKIVQTYPWVSYSADGTLTVR